MKDDPYHPDNVVERSKANNDYYNKPVDTGGKYTPAPKQIDVIEGLKLSKPKTPVVGGGGLRKRWKDADKNIYEWDSQHGALEKYNSRGEHLGEFDAKTGAQTKPANKKRIVEP